jgi:hypothetical protein
MTIEELKDTLEKFLCIQNYVYQGYEWLTSGFFHPIAFQTVWNWEFLAYGI